ncbi:MAG: DUF5700 domain-containing putative Zn-dependent protease [Candidatus Bathyarchaeia archaeon]
MIEVEIDATFVEYALDYLWSRSEAGLATIFDHEAAKGVHSHAERFDNTDDTLEGFWRKTLAHESKHKADHLKRIRSNLEFIKSNELSFQRAFNEVAAYLPADMRLRAKLYLIIGYDIGIVSGGNAYLNVGHPHFGDDRRELLYFSMHEVHHVGYTKHHPIHSLEGLRTSSDLIRAIEYSTHLEGLAVYSSYERRMIEEGVGHVDYWILNDPRERERVTGEFFGVLEGLEEGPDRPLEEADFEVLEQMSGGNRLWYVAGAHMAQEIDRGLGREALIQTVVDGPDSFFEAYARALEKRG